MFLNLCNFVFWVQPGAGRELYLRVFQLHLKILIVISSGGDDVGACCREQLSFCFQGVLSFHVVGCWIDFVSM